ncbi:hypothetical protein AB4Y43_01130 [Paraburkholderia sp. BR10872]|uniref:hypothetical protein n=1 Tax=Paraburkholderia sp. BR10872 TaxID=3236989 RepID=UPI0034D33D6A
MTAAHEQYAWHLRELPPLDEEAFHAARAAMGTNTELQDRMLYQAILTYVRATPQATLTDEQRETIREAAQCLSYAVTLTQDGYDGETGPASEWDMAAQRLSAELNAILAATKEQS